MFTPLCEVFRKDYFRKDGFSQILSQTPPTHGLNRPIKKFQLMNLSITKLYLKSFVPQLVSFLFAVDSISHGHERLDSWWTRGQCLWRHLTVRVSIHNTSEVSHLPCHWASIATFNKNFQEAYMTPELPPRENLSHMPINTWPEISP